MAKTLKLKLDDLDFEAIQEAITIRKSGLFRIDGELILPDGESEERGALLAEICRAWFDTLNTSIIMKHNANGKPA